MLQSVDIATSPPVFVAGLMPFNAAVDAWEERQRNIGIMAELYPVLVRLNGELPRWANNGPRSINGEGEWSADNSGWPEAEHYELPPISYAWRTVRVSPYDVRSDYKTRLRMLGNPEGKNYAAWRATARAQMRQRMRVVIRRVREQRRLLEELGIAAVERRIGAAVDGLIEVENTIRELHESADRTAALIMANVDDNCQPAASIAGDDRDATMEIAAVALKLLLPELSGLIREHAQFFVSSPTTPLREMPFKIPQ